MKIRKIHKSVKSAIKNGRVFYEKSTLFSGKPNYFPCYGVQTRSEVAMCLKIAGLCVPLLDFSAVNKSTK